MALYELREDGGKMIHSLVQVDVQVFVEIRGTVDSDSSCFAKLDWMSRYISAQKDRVRSFFV